MSRRPHPARPLGARVLAVFAACLTAMTARPLVAAPGDITAIPAPMMGADPPKAKEIRDGDVSVSTQTGALSYSYPITVPPGRLGSVVAEQTRNVAGQVVLRSANLAGLGDGWRNFTSSWMYDRLDRVIDQTVRDQTFTVHAVQHLGYFGLDDPHTLHHQLGSLIYDFTYDFDRRHQLSTVSEGQGRFAAGYSFTPGGKLDHVQVAAASGLPGSDVVNRDVTYQYASGIDPEAPSALAPVGGGANLRSYSYDTVGNLKDRREGAPTADPADTFTYDGEDQLRRAVKYAGGVAAGVEEYYYDHNGNRYAVVTRDAAGTVTGVRLFEGGSELELDPATGAVRQAYAYLSMGTPVAKIVSPPGGWAPGAQHDAASALELQYHGFADNTLLSVRPDGAVQAGFVYAPYGEIIESAGTTGGLAEQRRRFNDKHTDDQTGLHYYGVRYYDGLMLGWTQADPLYRFAPDAAWTEPRKANLYQLDLGNPLRYVDPDGRGPEAAVLIPPAAAYAAAAGIVYLANPRAGRQMAASGVAAAKSIARGTTRAISKLEDALSGPQIVRTGDIGAAICEQAQFDVIQSLVADGLAVASQVNATQHDATATTTRSADTTVTAAGGQPNGGCPPGTTAHIRLDKAAKGAYKITFASGMRYGGKGGTDRARRSARQKSRDNDDPVVCIEHRPADTDEESFRMEAEIIDEIGGPGGDTYNKINSPGATPK